MEDHQEMIVRGAAAAAPAAMYNASTGSGGGFQASLHGGDWWKWSNTAAASEQSPGSNSLVATGSSVTFQEPASVGADPACNIGAAAAAVPQAVAAGLATGWNHPFMDGSGFHGYMSSRGDHAHTNQASLMMSPSSSSSSMMLHQDQHDQNYQFLSSLGFELLSSPASSPYGGGSRASSLLRSLTEPCAAAPAPATAKPGDDDSPGFQQYQPPAPSRMNQLNQAAAAASTCRPEPMQFTNNTPYWNNPSTGFAAAPPPATQPRSTPAGSLAVKNAFEGVGDSGSIVKKANTDPKPPLKKSRTGTSPLPTFKVRKEKLGDRITALQQLVSPFGKTDTASVLHETIEYIKFLHEQVGAHSAPYLKNRQQQVPHHSIKSSTEKSKDGGGEGEKRDLTGRGLCLVPISSTFAVANETPVVDFWNPFGPAFR